MYSRVHDLIFLTFSSKRKRENVSSMRFLALSTTAVVLQVGIMREDDKLKSDVSLPGTKHS